MPSLVFTTNYNEAQGHHALELPNALLELFVGRVSRSITTQASRLVEIAAGTLRYDLPHILV